MKTAKVRIMMYKRLYERLGQVRAALQNLEDDPDMPSHGISDEDLCALQEACRETDYRLQMEFRT